VKVIFIEEVPGVARVGQSKTVAKGFARNYLIPYKLAVVEGSQAAKAAEKDVRKKINAREIEASEMSGLAEQVDGVEVTLEAKVGEHDKLYGSITAADIAAAVSEKVGRDIDRKKVDLAEPIRFVGSYNVTVKLMWDIAASVKVNVISDAPPVVEEKKPRGRKAEEVEAAEAPGAAATEETAEPAEETAPSEAVVEMPAIDEAVEDLAEEIEAEIEEK
jgi:large subunit ribosomal protein L9